ncbi:hypothetical protein J6TS1_03040 [Siminovitchia terrae]|uniref:Uncharacterized protein n=1 Tax=Siminovitchia terrae TaxID=1914933 RepID=A0ABQ4KS16_SIMTE|nr:hypothetical protein [Siminovitchia terrae]GIN94434.1 hypothetical protein J6TS1_03040 [Siminovitchia terrae]
MNACRDSIQRGGKPRLNKVKASGGCHRFLEEIYRAELDKIWAQIRQGELIDSLNSYMLKLSGRSLNRVDKIIKFFIKK